MKVFSRPIRESGFTVIEFLVAIGMIAVLVAILIPYLLQAREMSRRAACADHLRRIGEALSRYARENGSKAPFPETTYDSVRKPMGYVSFTGPDDPAPFARDSAVRPNDITASLWLLVREDYIEDTSVFVCPSTSDRPDALADASGHAVSRQKRGNFRSPQNLSYSYASPFTDAFNFDFSSDRLPAQFVILADKNPGFPCDTDHHVSGPPWDAEPFTLAMGNSRNHQRAGQNVLHPAGDVSFETTPYCGVSHDNIYTALEPHRLTSGHPDLQTPGYIGPDIGPSYSYDSYLVPTAEDVAPR